MRGWAGGSVGLAACVTTGTLVTLGVFEVNEQIMQVALAFARLPRCPGVSAKDH